MLQKQSYSRLQNMKMLCISGKGSEKLTDKLINELTVYYGLAIQRHPNSAEEMKKTVGHVLAQVFYG